jgi:hypothetical protein
MLNFYTFSGRWEDYLEIQLEEDLDCSGKYDNMSASELFATLEKESIEENWEGVVDV